MNHDGSKDSACGSTAESCSTIVPRNAESCHQVAEYLSAKPERESRPFVAQDGQCLYLVAPATRGWVVAELEFDPDSCVFMLKRQTEYAWPREALGRLLSRVISPESGDDREMHRMSDAFSAWLSAQFAT